MSSADNIRIVSQLFPLAESGETPSSKSEIGICAPRRNRLEIGVRLTKFFTILVVNAFGTNLLRSNTHDSKIPRIKAEKLFQAFLSVDDEFR